MPDKSISFINIYLPERLLAIFCRSCAVFITVYPCAIASSSVIGEGTFVSTAFSTVTVIGSCDAARLVPCVTDIPATSKKSLVPFSSAILFVLPSAFLRTTLLFSMLATTPV